MLTGTTNSLKDQLKQTTQTLKHSSFANPELSYVVKLERKLDESKQQEQRFLKVLKVLYNRGIDFKELKQEIEEQSDS